MRATGISAEEFARRLSLLLPRLARESWQSGRNLVSQGEASLPELWILRHLEERSACPMKELAAFLRLGNSTVTGLVDRLVRRGLVRRQSDASDRRVVLVVLSSLGRRVLVQMAGQKLKMLHAWFGRLTRGERAEFLRIVEKLDMVEGGAQRGRPAAAGRSEHEA
jgi:DNA-binding MarR family transcriptional regulator